MFDVTKDQMPNRISFPWIILSSYAMDKIELAQSIFHDLNYLGSFDIWKQTLSISDSCAAVLRSYAASTTVTRYIGINRMKRDIKNVFSIS